MNKGVKIQLAVATALVLTGIIIFAGAMSAMKWDFIKLSTSEYETNEHAVSEDFRSISIDTGSADIDFVITDNGECSVLCREQKNLKHTVEVKDGVLTIKAVDTRKWYEHIGINFGSPKVTVYIPSAEYGDLSVRSDVGSVDIPKELGFENINISESTGAVKCCASVSGKIKIKTSTGSITVSGVSAESIDLSVSTGKVSVFDVTCKEELSVTVSTGAASLTDVSCKEIISKGSTGGISLKNAVASESISIRRSTGGVIFDGCDAENIFVKTSTGSVRGSLFSGKEFITETVTGRVNIPENAPGGKCEIITDTGDIIIHIIQIV